MLRILCRKKNLTLLIFGIVVLIFIGINMRVPSSPVHLPLSLEEIQHPQLIVHNRHREEELRFSGNFTLPPVRMPDLPGVFNYLPHINQKPYALIPHVNISRGRTGVEFVIGVPSIKRPVDVYVYGTIQSLLSGLSEYDKEKVLIIVCITEPFDEAYEEKVVTEIDKRFSQALSEGVLEVITPKAEYYPNLSSLKLTLGDKKERVRWRSKQNLDYAYLMLHAWKRGKYYIQLEDDVSAQPGYVSKMEEAIARQYGEWFLLEFSTLGFIGRLFKSNDVPKVMEFLLMFYNQKPCDWLLDDYLRVQSCGHGEDWKKCLQKIKKVARPMTPSLFQHEGYHSSLMGTVNKLKDKQFGVNATAVFHNPAAEHIFTSIRTYSHYDIFSAYMGEHFFWGADPVAGDIIDFLYAPPIPIAKIYFVSGREGHEIDVFKDTVVEVMPAKLPLSDLPPSEGEEKTTQQKTAHEERMKYLPDSPSVDRFIEMGEFDESGKFRCVIPEKLGDIQVVRIRIRSPPTAWVILNEIRIELR